ncbi:MAG: hypothetical protein JSW51_10330 [Gemmatimonadota bacterium]|nr:MAG: hypothetical protein JSW51_10330 [Gemmatimonadota bacterium]
MSAAQAKTGGQTYDVSGRASAAAADWIGEQKTAAMMWTAARVATGAM